MTAFPLYVDLSEKNCVIIGGGTVAERKTEILLPFKPRITLISPELTERLREMAGEGQITVIPEKFRLAHLAGAYLVIAATSDPLVNEAVYHEAVRNNLWVNVVDCPEKCTFIFPAIVKREELVVGISTGGAYPALSKNLRTKIENILPENYSIVLPVLKSLRKRAGLEIANRQKRKKVLARIAMEIDAWIDFSPSVLKTQIFKRYEELKNEIENY